MSVYWNNVRDICESLLTSGSSLEAENSTMRICNKSTLDIGDHYLHAKAGPDVAAELAKLGPNPDASHISTFIGNLAKHTDQLSSDTIVEIQGIIATHYDKDQGGIWNSTLSQISSLLQAKMGQDTSTGDALGKTCQSQIQNLSSAGQPASNIGDALQQLLASGASAQAQISV